VVSAVQEEFGGVQHLVSIQEQRNLRRPGTSVDKVTVKEESILLRWVTGELENVEKIEVLTYDG
jgi:hypothetical protein